MSLISEVRKLRDKADKLRMKGQLQKALQVYRDLVRIDPENARWPHQAGEILKIQKKPQEAVKMFLEAASRYVSHGFGIQAIVLAKVILDMDPNQPQALDLLRRLSEKDKPQGASPGSGLSGAGKSSNVEMSSSPYGDRRPSVYSHSSVSYPKSHPPSVEIPSMDEFSLDATNAPSTVKAPSTVRAPGLGGSTSESPGKASPKPPPIPVELEKKNGEKAARDGSPPPFRPKPEKPGFSDPIAIEGNIPPAAHSASGSFGPQRKVRAGRPGTMEINLKSGETLDGLVLKDVVGSSGEYMPVGNDDDVDEEVLLPSDLLDADVEEPRSKSASSGSGTGDSGSAVPGGGTKGRRGGFALDSRLTSSYAMRRMEEAESEVSIVRAVSAFEVPIQEDEVDGLLENIFPDEEMGSLDEKPSDGSGQVGKRTPGGGGSSGAGTVRREGTTGEVVRALKTEAVTSTPLFGELSSDALEQLVARMSIRTDPAGTVIIEEGEKGGELYVVVEGDLLVNKKGPPSVTVGRLREGSFFGEIAIVTDLPRQASVVAETPVKLLQISRELVVDLIQDHPEVVGVLVRFFRRRMVEIILKTSPLFAPLDNSLRRDLAGRFKFLELDPNVRFIKQSRPLPGLFAILCGEAEVSAVYGGKTNILAELGPGDVVGETSLLSGRKAAHSVTAKSKCWMLFMPAKDLREAAVLIPEVVKYLRVLSMKRIRAAESSKEDNVEFPIERLPVY